MHEDEPRWVQVARAVLQDNDASADQYAICFAAIEHYEHGQFRQIQLARTEGQLETVVNDRVAAEHRVDKLIDVVSDLAARC
jgi:hypothetical protein